MPNKKLLLRQAFIFQLKLGLYPWHMKMRDSVGFKNALGKALIAGNGRPLGKINNAV